MLALNHRYLRHSVYVLFPELIWNRCFHSVHGNQVQPNCQPAHAADYVSMKYKSEGWLGTRMAHWRIKPARIRSFACGVAVSVNHVIYTCHFLVNTKHNIHVIITPKRQFDVVRAYLLRCVLGNLIFTVNLRNLVNVVMIYNVVRHKGKWLLKVVLLLQ